MGCFGSHQQSNTSIQTTKVPVQTELHKPSKVEEIDIIKVNLKVTRDKIENLTSQHEKQITALDRELQKQKNNGLRNKGKVLYLLKQKKDFNDQVNNLNTRKQAVSKTLGMLAQQQMDQQMVTVLQQSNTYMKKVQEQLQRKNWRQLVAQANTNRYNPIQFRQAEDDPQVDALYAQLEKQLFQSKTPQVKAKTVKSISGAEAPITESSSKRANLQYN